MKQMKKFSIRDVETMKTTSPEYCSGCCSFPELVGWLLGF